MCPSNAHFVHILQTRATIWCTLHVHRTIRIRFFFPFFVSEVEYQIPSIIAYDKSIRFVLLYFQFVFGFSALLSCSVFLLGQPLHTHTYGTHHLQVNCGDLRIADCFTTHDGDGSTTCFSSSDQVSLGHIEFICWAEIVFLRIAQIFWAQFSAFCYIDSCSIFKMFTWTQRGLI